jgi:hypothetical protein
MTDERIAAEEFARLMRLPDDHPDRRRAAASPQFEAMRLMLTEFEQPSGALPEAGQLEAATVELRRRLSAAGFPAGGAGVMPAAGEHSSRSPRSIAERLLGVLGGPGARRGLAFACALIVLGAGWWATHRSPQEATMRGILEPGAFALSISSEGSHSLDLTWTAVPGADGYRVTFLGADLGEIGHLDVAHGTRLVLHARDLPGGVAPGLHASLEVVALKDGAAIATTPARPVLLP